MRVQMRRWRLILSGRAPTSAEQVDGRLRFGVQLEALEDDRLVLGEMGLFCFSRGQQGDRGHR